MIDYRHSELLNPSGSTKYVAPNFLAREVDHQVKLPFKARHCKFVPVNIERAVGGGNNDMLSTFHCNSQLFRIGSLKNAEGCSRIHLGQ